MGPPIRALRRSARRRVFDLSEAGHVTVLDDGRVRHEASAGGMHHYLIVDDEHRARVKEALIYLASQPPDAPRRE